MTRGSIFKVFYRLRIVQYVRILKELWVKGGFWLPGTVLVLGKKYSKTGEPCHGLLGGGVENVRRFLYIYKEAGRILIKYNDITF